MRSDRARGWLAWRPAAPLAAAPPDPRVADLASATGAAYLLLQYASRDGHEGFTAWLKERHPAAIAADLTPARLEYFSDLIGDTLEGILAIIPAHPGKAR